MDNAKLQYNALKLILLYFLTTNYQSLMFPYQPRVLTPNVHSEVPLTRVVNKPADLSQYL